ncbi:hypothetical protein [Kyrpidia spormannii]|uniref:hypothetical protein n=1 Tax=Kyrpidia spormannii TaxID=2055160 RepID=UPI0018E4D30D|nr:hypothetical protein [Kyrpidia spormannii]
MARVPFIEVEFTKSLMMLQQPGLDVFQLYLDIVKPLFNVVELLPGFLVALSETPSDVGRWDGGWKSSLTPNSLNGGNVSTV